MGTSLHARGISYDHCFEQLNLTNPALIKNIHLDYVAAGAQIIETNTFGANRYRLAKHGLEHNVHAINRAGVEIAYEVRVLSNLPLFLAGNIGPLAPSGAIEPVEARAAFLEQIEALLQADVDLFLLETFSDLAEMREALTSLRSLTDLPIVALMTFRDDRTIASGEDPLTVGKILRELGADVVGANCTFGPASMLEIVKAMRHGLPEQTFIAAQPNAGLPQLVGNQYLYPATPEPFAEYTCHFLDAGVRLLGGCCGTTPQHIAAMKKALIR
jgi:homocysteine S-methyltransferase